MESTSQVEPAISQETIQRHAQEFAQIFVNQKQGAAQLCGTTLTDVEREHYRPGRAIDHGTYISDKGRVQRIFPEARAISQSQDINIPQQFVIEQRGSEVQFMLRMPITEPGMREQSIDFYFSFQDSATQFVHTEKFINILNQQVQSGQPQDTSLPFALFTQLFCNPNFAKNNAINLQNLPRGITIDNVKKVIIYNRYNQSALTYQAISEIALQNSEKPAQKEETRSPTLDDYQRLLTLFGVTDTFTELNTAKARLGKVVRNLTPQKTRYLLEQSRIQPNPKATQQQLLTMIEAGLIPNLPTVLNTLRTTDTTVLNENDFAGLGIKLQIPTPARLMRELQNLINHIYPGNVQLLLATHGIKAIEDKNRIHHQLFEAVKKGDIFLEDLMDAKNKQ